MKLFNTAAKPSGPRTDDQILSSGMVRFDREKSNYFGSPETMRSGAAKARRDGDVAAAFFFYGKALDIAQTWSFDRPDRPVSEDIALFREFVSTLSELLAQLKDKGALSNGYNIVGNEAFGYMVLVTNARQDAGHDVSELRALAEQAHSVASFTPRYEFRT